MSAPPLHILLLGSPLVTVKGQPLEVDRRKAVALLAYLAVTSQRHQREALATLLWPEHGQARARANLRQALWVLKNALGQSWLQMDRESVELHSGFYLDVAVFLESIAAAQVDGTQAQNHNALALLDNAVTLYRDSFLTGFTLPDAAQFDEWSFFQSQHLRIKLETALQLLIQGHSQQQRWERAIDYGQRWLALDPLHEPAHVSLIKLYAQAGKKAAARRQYELLEQILADELGTAPQAETRRFYENIVHNQTDDWLPAPVSFVLNGSTPDLPLPDGVPAPGPLPPGSRMSFKPNPLFAGREDELHRLAQAFKVGMAISTGPTVIASGLGGIGKTQLAVEFAHRYGRYFPGGVFWLSFADADAVANEVAGCGSVDGLNLQPNFDERKLAEQIKLVQRAWQETTPRLLIFDNCEDEALLRQWRPAVGGCRVLVTSRRGRWHPALAVTTVALAVLQRDASVWLLRQYVPDMAKTDAEAIATELGDLPLALHLAGSFLARYGHVVSPALYLDQLRQQKFLQHPSLTGRGASYSPTAHEAHVAGTFALCYRQLDVNCETDQLAMHLLARAAFFAHGKPIPRDLLLATLGTTVSTDLDAALLAEDALERLVALGLLAEDSSGALSLHRLLALFVREMAGNREAQAAVEEAVLRWAQRLNTAGYPAALSAWQGQLRHITAAACERGDAQAASLCSEVGYHLHAAGDPAGARPYLEQAVVIREQLLGENHADTAESLHRLGYLLHEMGEYKGALPYYQRALAIREQILGEYHSDTATTLNNLGYLLQAMGSLEQARSHYERALAIRESLLGEYHPDTAHSLNALGTLMRVTGALPEAQRYHERALAIREEVLGQSHPDTTQSLNNLGELMTTQGEYAAARAYYQRALAVREQTLGPRHFATAAILSNLGFLLHKTGEYEESRSYYERALTIDEEVSGPDHPDTAHSLNNLGGLLTLMGEFEAAQTCLERALTIRESVLGPIHPHTGQSLDNLGVLLQAMAHSSRALHYHERALAILEQALGPDHPHTATCLHNIAKLLGKTGKPVQAQPIVKRALAIRRRKLGPEHPETAESIHVQGQLHQMLEQPVEAEQYFRQALTILEPALGSLHPKTERVQKDWQSVSTQTHCSTADHQPNRHSSDKIEIRELEIG